MSSFDIDEDFLFRNNADKIEPEARERLLRQICDFSMGVSLAFPQDPSMDFSPYWISNTHKKDKKTALKHLGATEFGPGPQPGEAKATDRYGSEPTAQACHIVLQRAGYGKVWPPLPDAFRTGTGGEDTKYLRNGIVGRNEYLSRMRKIAGLVKEAHTSLRNNVQRYEKELMSHILEMTEADRGRTSHQLDDDGSPMAQQVYGQLPSDDSPGRSSTSLDHLQGIAKFLSEAWKETVQSVNKTLQLDGTGIEMGFEAMPLGHAPDMEILKQHATTTGIYKHGKTLTPWIDFNPSCNTQGLEGAPAEARRPYNDWSRQVRAAFLVPHLNMAELSRAENLLTMIHHRARKHPVDFVTLDHQACHIGRMSRILRGFFSGFLGVRFSDDLSDYIVLDSVFPNLDFVRASNETFRNGVKSAPSVEVTNAYANGTLFGTGDAHIILLSQAVMYKFLDGLCGRLLKDRAEGNSKFDNDPSKAVNDEEVQESELAGRNIEKFEREQRENRIYMAEVFSQYAPRRNHDFDTYLTIFEDEAWSAKNRFGDEMNNAQAFLERFLQELGHHYGHLKHADDGPLLVQGIANLPASSKQERWDLYYDIVGGIYRGHLLENLMWEDLARLIRESLEEILKSTDTGQSIDFSQPYNLPGTMTKQMQHLLVVCREYYLYFLSELVHRGKFVASGKLRHLFTCVTDRKQFRENPEDNTPRLKKSLRNFPRTQVQLNISSEDTEELKELCQVMFNILGNPIAVSISSMKKLVDGIRLMNWDTEVNKYLSDHVMSIIERMSILVDFASHLDSLRLVRREVELNGLFRKGGKFDSCRTDYRWITGFRNTDIPPIISMEKLDNFAFEEWENVPRRYYRRIYEWLDERQHGDEDEADEAEQRRDDEATVQLKKLAFAIFDHLGIWEVKDERKPLTDQETARATAAGLDPEDPIAGGMLAIIPPATLDRLRRIVQPQSQGPLPATPRPWDTPPLSPAGEDNEQGNVPDDTHSEAADEPPTNPDDSINTLTSSSQTSSQRRRTLAERALDRYNRVFRENAGTLRILGPGRTRTPSRIRQKRAERAARLARMGKMTQNTGQPDDEGVENGEDDEVDGFDPRVEISPGDWKNLTDIYSHTRAAQPTAMTWGNFESGLRRLGYRCLRSNGGSRVRFVWTEDCAWAEDQDGQRKLGVLHFHRPHDNKDVSKNMMRNLVRKLENFGVTWVLITRFYKEKEK